MGARTALIMALVSSHVLLSSCRSSLSWRIKNLDENTTTWMQHFFQRSINDRMLLVVLLESSSDWTDAEFYQLKVFVLDLLKQVQVGLGKTTIAVIRVSETSDIIIDDIRSYGSNNICEHKDKIESISYVGGQTNYSKAFILVKKIFTDRLHDIWLPTVLLISRGIPTKDFSDVQTKVRDLMDMSVQVFTVLVGGVSPPLAAITTLRSLASNDRFLYISSIQRMGQLGRMITGDPSEMMVSPPYGSEKYCVPACNLTTQVCSCDLLSGNHGCFCKRGYYLDGVSKSCQACPRGTYKEEPNLEDSCIRCPDNSYTKEVGSFHPFSCECNPGYISSAGTCNRVSCMQLDPPINGMFVNPEVCLNALFGDKCYIACDDSCNFEGYDVITCGADRNWSNRPRSCTVESCPFEMVYPQTGFEWLTCSRSVTNLLNGSSCVMNCLRPPTSITRVLRVCSNRRWTGPLAACKD